MSEEEMNEQAKNILNEIRKRSKEYKKDEFGRRIFAATDASSARLERHGSTHDAAAILNTIPGSMGVPKEMLGEQCKAEDNISMPQAKDLTVDEPMGGEIYTVGKLIEGSSLVIASRANNADHTITISNHERMMVEIDTSNGEIKFGESYDFDETSKMFWECMGKDSPSVLKVEIAVLKEEIKVLQQAAQHLQESYCNDDMDAERLPFISEPVTAAGARLACSAVRRQITKLAKPYIFEPNDKKTRTHLAATITKYLDTLYCDRRIFDFTVVCDETNNPQEVIDRNELKADVAIQQSKSSDYIYIPLHIKPTIPKFVTDMDDEILNDVIRDVQDDSYENAMKVIE